MKYLLNTITSKFNNLDLTIEEILYNELNLILQQLKTDFRNNNSINFKQNIEKLIEINNLRNRISSHLNSYDFKNKQPEGNINNNNEYTSKNTENNKKEEDSKNNKETKSSEDIDEYTNEKNNALSVSSNTVEAINQEDFDKRLSRMLNTTDDTYYFHNFSQNYGEENNKLSLSYSIKSLDEFNMFSIKISGLKLFDNVFFGRTINESMSKMFSFLFMLNEKPFISLCSQNSKYFASSPNNMQRAITLKTNECYYESNVDEKQASEMLKQFLEHINVEKAACKILLDCSTNKIDESFISFIL